MGGLHVGGFNGKQSRTLLEEKARFSAGREAVVYADRGLRWTYPALTNLPSSSKRVHETRHRQRRSYGHLGTNTPEWLISQFSTGKMGAVLVTVNTNYQRERTEYLLDQSDSQIHHLDGRISEQPHISICSMISARNSGIRCRGSWKAQLSQN